jgi:hypothetical protein
MRETTSTHGTATFFEIASASVQLYTTAHFHEEENPNDGANTKEDPTNDQLNLEVLTRLGEIASLLISRINQTRKSVL